MVVNKIFKTSLLTLFAVVFSWFLLMPSIRADNLAEQTTVILHHGKLNSSGNTDGINTNFIVYDITKQYQEVGQTETAQEQFFEKIAGMNATQITSYVSKNALNRIAEIQTDASGRTPAFIVNSNVKAALIVQNGTSQNTAGEQITSQPLVLSFPVVDDNGIVQSSVDVYTKSTLVPPNKPEEPTPNQPGHPGVPNKPEEPTPNLPSHPGVPNKPEKPANPGNPTPGGHLPTTGAFKRNSIWIGLVLIVSGLVASKVIKRKGEFSDEKEE
ncbi:pilin N-terminal domain-containing protein [Ligilactobacillus pobuzihii]|uniref:Gram-positive pilin subunit D1 N-terminal domain-containing protein n=1 Tax=Ligilactobacillus pobuzihii TaxID=449659 RepID=A0A0R2LFK5_9LACO|nr:pilin N-terminal domain-containing protein [Ligilactobacillus pobuzihii]KRK09836.1 hypothetical protein FD11_GL000404 [Ligilactobacillus pobuzihii E100301 = KCTC 13174]KRO00680.1 hypothetical protein IV66_GL001357 [Ligilactobacillus pobuzihii]GEN48569.1 hypothetical protein LPO01_13610 [Ligilactobacillus pobuzihii]